MGPFVNSFDDYITADFVLRRAFQQKHEGADSHPVLTERVAAIENSSSRIPLDRIEQFVRMCLTKELSAAEICFNGKRGNMTAKIDGLWQKMLEFDWAQRHAYMKQRREELDALKAKVETSPLSADESIQLAQLTESIHGPEKAMPLYQQLAASNPDNMQIVFTVGRLLLEKKDAAGQPMIEQVMQKAPSSRSAGCELLAKFHYDLGDLEQAKLWRFKMEDEYDACAAIEHECANLTTGDKFLPHGLDETMVKKICEMLATVAMPIRVCLAQKIIKLAPDEPCYALVAHRIVSWWQWADSGSAEKKNQQLFEQLLEKIKTPLNLYIFVEPQPVFYKKIKKIKNAQIFSSAK
jgi:tetratricopeptide (TPR) repeat protein